MQKLWECVEKLEELIPQLKIFAETFSVYFLQRYPSGTFYIFTFNFIIYDKFNESEGGGQQGC